MRSILKSHKRNDSAVSDSYSPSEGTTNKTPMLRSSDSPTFGPQVKMTPPTNTLGLQQLAKSSPKKLLTPIKKMFGHHPKNPVIPASTETLQAIINGDLEPPRDYRFGRLKQKSSPNLSELRTRDQSISRDTTSLASINQSTSQKTSVRSADSKLETHYLKKNDENSNGSVKFQNIPLKDTKVHTASLNTSDLSIATSKNGFHVCPANEDMGAIEKFVRESSYDDDLKDSDNSSQFSFVKDNRGGRNTSIKYYKTKTGNVTGGVDTEPSNNYFSIEDPRFDADGYSDYDYENNGISDEDELDDGFPGGTNRYGEFFSDRDSYEAVHTPKTPKLQTLHVPLQNVNHQLSPGCSNQTPACDVDEINPQTLPMSDLRSPGYAGDFLDTYLESRLPVNYLGSIHGDASTPNEMYYDSNKNLAIEETGVGLGIEMPRNDLNDAESIHSVTNMMDTLRKLEGSPVYRRTQLGTNTSFPQASEDKKEDSIRKSDPKGISTSMEIKETQSSEKRQSVADMMAKLSFLGNLDKSDQERNVPETAEKSDKSHRKEKKRYSWFSNEDSYGRSEIGHHSGLEETSGDRLSLSMDEDLLDEINLIPENFDFNDQEQNYSTQPTTPSFLRSNSYNKKPQKVANEYNYQEQKIKLPNKTVTFYRSKSLDREKPHMIHNPARAASLRSVTSFNDEDISEGEEEDYHNLKNSSIDKLLENTFYAHPNNLIPQKSGSLEPISESETPKLA